MRKTLLEIFYPKKMNNIKTLRKKHGWTQTQLAEKLGVTLRTVQNYEANGYPKLVELALKQIDNEESV